MNNVMLIGRYNSIDKVTDNEYVLVLVISDKDGDLTLPVKVTSNLADQIINFCHEGDLFGIKGFIDVDNNELCIVASKLSFISKKAD